MHKHLSVKTITNCIFGIFIILATFLDARSIPPYEGTRQTAQIQQIIFPDFPGAFNPSIINSPQGIILIFRWIPDSKRLHVSHTCAVLLDQKLNPIGSPQILNHRTPSNLIPSQAEDARIFLFEGELYIIYNDNMEVELPHTRHLYLAKLSLEDGKFSLAEPIKLFHPGYCKTRLIEKNWSPFEWNGHLLLSYSLSPHEVLKVNLKTGCCSPICYTESGFRWNWGGLRGGSPAQLIGEEYFAFSHSYIYMESPVSNNTLLAHYFAGAYTFESNPPFAIKRITQSPIMCKGLYTDSKYEKRVIYPAGFVLFDDCLHLAYGKDDSEIWIATFSWKQLQQCLIPIETVGEKSLNFSDTIFEF